MESLLTQLTNIHHIGDDARLDLEASLTRMVLPKNELLITEGRVCRHLYFIESGSLRGFYNQEGKEVTHWFGFESDFVTSFHSFITGQPSVENIQLMDGTILWAITKEALTALMNKHHDMERLVRKSYERYYIRLEERFINAHFKTATERYEQLLEESPHIIEKVPLGYIASYLGISQETLSRVRSRL
ncbi:Crp/Fnr family transcriptional regulator [Chitinophaga sp. sic0106]|uniref:Crp/Fnr family transcriptional regulator n=1 Tax=Chitinophaga sp. sic0106 TaxID=2854785 RepID=UPI001C4896A6|nr:Crp/Fnr family transcriptional regulator [Chitinophaga sp. sic0106]MBV7532886.1 Crp/Fnr family transcriptional regulator [Chitinophaga sp. sic0106]